MRNALAQKCLAGGVNEARRADALAALDASPAHAFVLLVSNDTTHAFKAIYELVAPTRGGGRGRLGAVFGRRREEAVRVFGKGPARVREEYVGAFYKYDSTRRRFDALPSRSFTRTTDAVSVDMAKLQRFQRKAAQDVPGGGICTRDVQLRAAPRTAERAWEVPSRWGLAFAISWEDDAVEWCCS